MIDDDVKLAILLKEYFAGFGMELFHAASPSEGLRLLRQSPYDLLILDVMMPEMDGFEVCKRVRSHSQIPILMLTARGEVADRVLGLELGVDDYLPKPFESRELVARVKALLRRGRRDFQSQKWVAGDLVLDLASHDAEVQGGKLGLSHHEFELLKLLMSRPHQALNRDQIMDALKGIDWEAFQRGIDVAISRLRQKLGDSAKEPRFIKTIWGEGYAFIHEVKEEA